MHRGIPAYSRNGICRLPFYPHKAGKRTRCPSGPCHNHHAPTRPCRYSDDRYGSHTQGAPRSAGRIILFVRNARKGWDTCLFRVKRGRTTRTARNARRNLAGCPIPSQAGGTACITSPLKSRISTICTGAPAKQATNRSTLRRVPAQAAKRSSFYTPGRHRIS